MSHTFIICGARTVINVITAVFLLETFSVHALQEKINPSMAFLTSIYRSHIPNIPSADETNSRWAPEPFNIYLGNQPKYSVLISLAKNKISAYAEDIFEERGTVGLRSFIVEAPTGYGIIAVIQVLNLGLGQLEIDQVKGKVNHDNLDRCKNYVKFSDGDGSDSGEICGQMHQDDKDFHPQGLIGPRTFHSSNGKMIVSFNFGELSDFLPYKYQTLLRPGHNEDFDKGPLYELAISFTSFTDCQPNQADAFIPCTSNKNANRSCISSSLFCDDVLNCGFEDDFGYDEKNCSVLPESELSKSLTYWTIRPDEEGVRKALFNPIREPDTDITYDPSLDRILQYSLSPASTILLIVITVVCIMIMGIIIRFCCRRCVGTPLPIPNPSTTDFGPFSTDQMSLGSRNTQIDIQRSPYQCSRTNYALDLPPSYEDLFPSSKDINSSISFVDISASASDTCNRPGSSDLVKVPVGN